MIRTGYTYCRSSCLSMFMHLWTSVMVDWFDRPDRFPPHMLRSNTRPEVKSGICSGVSQGKSPHGLGTNAIE